MGTIIVDFYDSEATYGRIKVDEQHLAKIQELLDAYRARDAKEEFGYNIDDFLEILRRNNIRFEEIPMEADVNIYF